MITYEENVRFSGDGKRAFDIALAALLPLGFQIESQNSTQLVFSGGRYFSTKQNALLGMSRVEFNLRPATLGIKAELGGVAKMQRFLQYILVGLCLFDVILFTILWVLLDELHPHPWILAIPLAVFIPWILIAPKMTTWIRERSVEAINSLLSKMTSF